MCDKEEMFNIIINGAYEGNLKNVSLKIPRNQLVVFTGLSGSGKSTLLMDVLYMECQRQYLEAMAYQGIHKPKVEEVRNASPAIIISQSDVNRNPRSTVGTLTDIYTDLRMIYEKLGIRTCPHCNERISAVDCREEVEKKADQFKVYMYCCKCGKRMDKLTRTDFSFNTREGACPVCEGLGEILSVQKDRAVDERLTLADGAVQFWEKRYGEYQIGILYHAYEHYGIPVPENHLPVAKYSRIQKEVLYNGVDTIEMEEEFPEKKPPRTVTKGRFEGVIPMLYKRMSEKGGDSKRLRPYFEFQTCQECGGERLNKLSRGVTVNGIRLPELSIKSLEEIYEWLEALETALAEGQSLHVEDYVLDMKTKVNRILAVGLGYLTLDRQAVTLSGGEMQRLRLAAALSSTLTGIIYIMDEPTIGLHPKDTKGLTTVLKKLRDLNNTVLVIEHDPDVMKEADYIIDIGPGAGKHGGTVIGTGTLNVIKKQQSSVTGTYLREKHPGKRSFRRETGQPIEIEHANLYNLKNVDISFPTGCLTAVTGVSGSGKSTLIFEILAKGEIPTRQCKVIGTRQFDQIVTIEQIAINRMKRSNVATYSEVYTEIRKIFAKTEDAKDKGLTSKHFSFNTPGGRCENCEGLGKVTSNLLFFEDVEVTCPICGGNQFQDDILEVKYQGHSIKEVLDLSVEEALLLFKEQSKIKRILDLLANVGLGYLELGQTLTTLSGGEGQRLKLAKELINSTGKKNLYLLDEPTTGLHPKDVEHFMTLLDHMVDEGNTVIVVEHNLQVVRNSDWIVDLGPEGGRNGGNVIFTGTPLEMMKSGRGSTADHLRLAIEY